MFQSLMNQIKLRKEGINDHGVDVDYDDDDKATSTMFINIDTSEGLLQFAAYNSHNGYYGHSVCYMINNHVEQERTL